MKTFSKILFCSLLLFYSGKLFSQCLTLSITKTDVSCFGVCDGKIIVSANAGVSPYTYSWSPSGGVDSINSALCAGTYTVTVTDAVNCTESASILIATPDSIAIIGTVKNPTCYGVPNGSITVNVSGGMPPYQYIWSGGVTTPTNSWVGRGTYTVYITDSKNCTVQKSFIVDNESEINFSSNITDASCLNSKDGAIDISVSGGTVPYSYSWSNSATTEDIDSLNAGVYTLIVTDSLGCVIWKTDTVISNGGTKCSHIKGKIFYDKNTDCIFNSGDMEISDRIMEVTPGPFYVSTDTNGNFAFQLSYGTYTVKQITPPYLIQKCPVSDYTLTLDSANNNFENIDFADSITSPELLVYLVHQTARPGFRFKYMFCYLNKGVPALNGAVYFVYDDTLILDYVSTPPDSSSGNTLFWNITNLGIGKGLCIDIFMDVPADVNLLGYTLNACAYIVPATNETNRQNNTTCNSHTIVGSADPNEKEVNPKGDITSNDTILSYIIRFQNTGTDTAFTVIIKDTLSPFLDIKTLEPGPSSHSNFFTLKDNVLTWQFNNILLPDSNRNEPASHGFVQFSIKPKPDNPIGTIIENQAPIYFDFNPAVITNKVATPLTTAVGTGKVRLPQKSKKSIFIYPNPSTQTAIVQYSIPPAGIGSLKICTLGGVALKVYSLESNKISIEISTAALNTGLYICTLVDAQGVTLEYKKMAVVR